MNTLLLGNTGLRISSRALGTARLRDDAEAHRVMHRFADAGGTLFDSSNAYLAGHAEELLGDFLRDRGRDGFVVCTKFGRPIDAQTPDRLVGSHRGAMRASVEASLRRLRTDRIDLYLVHLDDGVTPIDEIARGLEDLAREGKIVHAGLSNFPAWRIAATHYPFAAIQMQYHLGERSIEREHLPLARARHLTVMAWSPLGGGTVLREPRLVELAARRGCPPATLAIAWVEARGLVPVLGARTVEQLEPALLDADASELDSAFDRGYPYELLDEVRASYRLPRRDVL